jgi:hypothetical protein
MRKVYLFGLALLGVFAFGTAAASSAFAEKVTGSTVAFWLVNGVAPANGVALNADVEGELLLRDLNAGEVLCSGLFEGTIENTAAEGGVGLITMVVELTTGNLIELGVRALSCTNDAGSTFCEEGHPIEVWAQNLPWLVSLILMTLNSEEVAQELFLILLSEDGFGKPAYEVKCTKVIAFETLCEGQTSAWLELMVEPTGNVLLGIFNEEEQELEGLEAVCGGVANTGVLETDNGGGVIQLAGSTEELDVSSER